MSAGFRGYVTDPIDLLSTLERVQLERCSLRSESLRKSTLPLPTQKPWRPHVRKPPMKIIIEEWDGDGAIRIPDEALQELELDVGDSLFLIEEFVGNTRWLVLSKKPQITDRIDEFTEAWNGEQHGSTEDK
jgi:antitoxin component of MazEF toxin-antitoxin module